MITKIDSRPKSERSRAGRYPSSSRNDQSSLSSTLEVLPPDPAEQRPTTMPSRFGYQKKGNAGNASPAQDRRAAARNKHKSTLSARSMQNEKAKDNKLSVCSLTHEQEVAEGRAMAQAAGATLSLTEEGQGGGGTGDNDSDAASAADPLEESMAEPDSPVVDEVAPRTWGFNPGAQAEFRDEAPPSPPPPPSSLSQAVSSVGAVAGGRSLMVETGEDKFGEEVLHGISNDIGREDEDRLPDFDLGKFLSTVNANREKLLSVEDKEKRRTAAEKEVRGWLASLKQEGSAVTLPANYDEVVGMMGRRDLEDEGSEDGGSGSQDTATDGGRGASGLPGSGAPRPSGEGGGARTAGASASRGGESRRGSRTRTPWAKYLLRDGLDEADVEFRKYKGVFAGEESAQERLEHGLARIRQLDLRLRQKGRRAREVAAARQKQLEELEAAARPPSFGSPGGGGGEGAAPTPRSVADSELYAAPSSRGGGGGGGGGGRSSAASSRGTSRAAGAPSSSKGSSLRSAGGGGRGRGGGGGGAPPRRPSAFLTQAQSAASSRGRPAPMSPGAASEAPSTAGAGAPAPALPAPPGPSPPRARPPRGGKKDFVKENMKAKLAPEKKLTVEQELRVAAFLDDEDGGGGGGGPAQGVWREVGRYGLSEDEELRLSYVDRRLRELGLLQKLEADLLQEEGGGGAGGGGDGAEGAGAEAAAGDQSGAGGAGKARKPNIKGQKPGEAVLAEEQRRRRDRRRLRELDRALEALGQADQVPLLEGGEGGNPAPNELTLINNGNVSSTLASKKEADKIEHLLRPISTDDVAELIQKVKAEKSDDTQLAPSYQITNLVGQLTAQLSELGARRGGDEGAGGAPSLWDQVAALKAQDPEIPFSERIKQEGAATITAGTNDRDDAATVKEKTPAISSGSGDDNDENTVLHSPSKRKNSTSRIHTLKEAPGAEEQSHQPETLKTRRRKKKLIDSQKVNRGGAAGGTRGASARKSSSKVRIPDEFAALYSKPLEFVSPEEEVDDGLGIDNRNKKEEEALLDRQSGDKGGGSRSHHHGKSSRPSYAVY